MSSPSPKQNNIQFEHEDDAYSPTVKRKEPLEDASTLTTPVKRTKSGQGSVETDVPVSEGVDLNDTSLGAQQALPSTPSRQLQHFFTMQEAVKGGQRRPVAPADDDIQEVKHNENEWAAKILGALCATDRDRPMLEGYSVEEWTRLWPRFNRWLPKLQEDTKNVEQKAWMVLREVFDLQEYGYRLKTTRSKNSSGRRFEPSQMPTMKSSARLDQLIPYLATCSCLACNAIEGEHLHDIVADPAGVLDTKAKDKAKNDKRPPHPRKGGRRKSSVASHGSGTDTEQQQQDQVTPGDRGERLSALDDDALATPDRDQRGVTGPPQRLFHAYNGYPDSHTSARPQFTQSGLPVGNQTIGISPLAAGYQSPFPSSRTLPNQTLETHPPTTTFQQPFTSQMPPDLYAMGYQPGPQGSLPGFGPGQVLASHGAGNQTASHSNPPAYYIPQQQQQQLQYQRAEVEDSSTAVSFEGGTGENPIELDDMEDMWDVGVKKVESRD